MLKNHLSHLWSSKCLDCSLLFFFFSLPLSDVQIQGSCEAGALRRGPKKECRDSMIHKAELFNGWMHVEHSAPAEPGSPQNRCRLVCKPLQQHTQHNSGRLPKISSWHNLGCVKKEGGGGSHFAGVLTSANSLQVNRDSGVQSWEIGSNVVLS